MSSATPLNLILASTKPVCLLRGHPLPNVGHCAKSFDPLTAYDTHAHASRLSQFTKPTLFGRAHTHIPRVSIDLAHISEAGNQDSRRISPVALTSYAAGIAALVSLPEY